MSNRTTIRSARRTRLIGAAAATAALLTPLASIAPASASPATVNFAFIGDVPYTPAEQALLPALVADINADPDVQLTAHSGDFKGGSDSCSDASFNTTLTGFQGFTRPFWYTPGDNDWTDCHRDTNGNFDPLTRLAKVRQLYFATPGQTTPVGAGLAVTRPVHTQPTLAENTWFNQDCVTFGDIHAVSSANGLLHPNLAVVGGKGSSGYVDPLGVAAGQAARDAEVATRTAADLTWIDAIFDAATTNNSDGVFLMTQAEPALLADQPAPANVTGNDVVSTADEFAAIRAKVFARAQAFAKPVILAHGDQHVYTITPTYGGQSNITRLENFGSSGAVQKWIQVRATCGTSFVFSQRPRTIGQTAGAFVDFATNVPPATVPEGPLAIGAAAIAALAGAGVWATRRRLTVH